MKHKFSLIWRVAVALVLVLSFSLVAATPVMASTVSGQTEDAIGITDATGNTLESIPTTGTIYIWVHDQGTAGSATWSTDAWTQETVTVTLKVYRGDGTRLVSTNSYTAIEKSLNDNEFRTAAISVSDLGVEPGYRLLPSLTGAQEYGPAASGSIGTDKPYYIRAQIQFVESALYDIDGTMTLRVKDDSLNTASTSKQTASDATAVTIDESGSSSTTDLKTKLKETGNDTGVFEYVTTPNKADDDIWCSHTMVFIYQNTNKTTLGATSDKLTGTAYVSPTSPSSVSFDPATIASTVTSVKVVAIDRDESSNPTADSETISNAVVVKSLGADDSVIDSLTVGTLTEATAGGRFTATVTFGTAVTQLDVTGAAKLQATYTDPDDSSDVSTATAAFGTTVDLYDAAGTLKGSYTAIQAAVNAALATGYTVEVSEAYNSADDANWTGTHPGFPIVIDKNKLTVKSIGGAASTTIDASGSADTSVIKITAADVVLGGSDSGFTIIGDTGTGTANGAVVFYGAGCTNPTVQGNIITGKLIRGIYSEPTDTQFDSYVTIKDNTISSTQTATTGSGGIYVFLDAKSVIDNNDVSGFGDGISLYGLATSGSWTTPITVSNNTCHNNTWAGIGLDAGCGHCGVLDYVLVSGNDLYENGTDGIVMWGANLDKIKVVGNNLCDNEGSGIRLWSGTGNANHVYVFGNNIYGNTTTVGTVTTDDYAIMNEASLTVPADHNWWGDASGPSTGSFSGLVTYTPWLEAEVSAAAFAHGDGTTGVTSLDAKTTVGVQISGLPTDTSKDNAIGAALYTDNPKATPTFTVVEDSYTNVYVNYGTDTPAATDEVILKFSPAGIDEDSVVYAWNEVYGTWVECTHQDYSSYAGGYIWVKVHSELNTTEPTIPTIEALAGLPFAISAEEVRTLQSIEVTPATASVGVGGTKQFTATGTYNLEPLTEDITTEVTWTSSNLSVATIDATGLATGVAEGTTNITATLDTIVSDPVAVLTVSVFDVYELYDADEDGVISKSEATTAVVDYFDGTITKDQALLVIVEYMG